MTFIRLLLPLLLLSVVPCFATDKKQYSRGDFPKDFVFGSGISAYQYEGAASEEGRTPAIWDTFAHSGQTSGANGDVACDGYHKYKEDIRLASETNLEAFRFSISWPRLIPNGRGPVNPLGLQYYNDFINQLLSHGIEPHITLHHDDLPQALEDEYGGWLSSRIVKDFTAYADVCFREFGDRVKFWTTVNEANVFSLGGYSEGLTPPGRCSPAIREGCVGNSSTEAYIAGHNILLTHSATWKLYRQKYKDTQNGCVGLNVYTFGAVPYSTSEADIVAAQRLTDFYIGWLINPLIFGDYPQTIKERARGRIPLITEQESENIKGSFDFIGVNHYTTLLVKDNTATVYNSETWGFDNDMGIAFEVVGSDKTPPFEYPVVPWGLYRVLEYFKQAYDNPPIFVQENGQSTRRNKTLSDTTRAKYLDAYIGSVLEAIRNGSNTKGYFQWTFFDCLELLQGYNTAFGLYYVDLDDPQLKRYRKFSARWYADFLKGKSSM